ncbi:MAG: response regulator, partial [Thiohalocapsa sp.]
PELGAGEHAQSAPQAVDGTGRRALVADDREDNRNLLREMLEPNGFEVREAVDGGVCVREALDWRPDLMLVDLKMPVLDGEGVIRRVRAEASLRDTTIIAVSASVFGENEEQCLDAGADAFLPKPVQLERLLMLLQRHLGLTAIPPAPSRAPAVTETETIADAPMPVLPRDIWQQLVELARRGDVQGLRERLATLAEGDGAYAPLTDELAPLLERFQMRRLRERLESLPHKP